MGLNQKHSKIYYGWYIVGACFLITVYTAGVVFFGFTAFFEPIVKEFDWSYAQISLAASLRGLEIGLLAPIMGLLVDRWGPRRLIFTGSILVYIGFFILSRTSSLAMFYGAFAFIAIGMSTCTQTVLMPAVANWFRRKIGVAIGKDGRSVKRVERMIGKTIKLFEFSKDISTFVKNVIPQAKAITIKNENGRVIVEIKVEKKDRPFVIGRDRRNLKFYKKVLQRSHKVDDIVVK